MGELVVKVLLDSHAVIWALRDPARLSPAARDVLRDRGVDLLCSPVTPWELATKHRLGRFPDAAALLAAYPEHLERLGATELAITGRHGLLAGRLEWEHRDPFDRMLAAQSILDGVALVTADRAFSTLPGVAIVW